MFRMNLARIARLLYELQILCVEVQRFGNPTQKLQQTVKYISIDMT